MAIEPLKLSLAWVEAAVARYVAKRLMAIEPLKRL